ncbi:MAG: 1-acyl-sn-glycerol-3-phosphate acyltransferase [Ruminococcus sp.]|nr:1-acyl-sn-glycerol-3-phosphate acyltransferase [Ruminococcus sp.]
MHILFIFLNILMGIVFVVLGVVALLVLLFIFVGICSLFADRNKVYDKESKFFRFLLTYSTAIARVLLRIKLDVRGMDKVPKGRFLLVSNHRSKFDPILTWLVFKKQHIAFISKESNFKVPIFGRIIRKCCFMAIDRENPREALKTINQAIKLIKNDEVSVGVYPEGTRNYEEGLLPFHNAVFKIAVKAKVPIVILTVRGAYDIQKNYPWKRSVVRMDICEVMSADKVSGMKTGEIGDYVRDVMNKSLTEG